MSFQAYITNIENLTHQTVAQIHDKAITDGIITPSITATLFIEYLAKTYQLGRGHSMALWKLFIENNWISPKQTKVLK